MEIVPPEGEATSKKGEYEPDIPLIQAPKDDDWKVRQVAAIALRNINDTRATEALTRLGVRRLN